MKSFKHVFFIGMSLFFIGSEVISAENKEYQLIIENHQFQPAELKVPANEKFNLVVENKDATAEEFESHSLKKEKVIPGKSKAIIKVGPLKAGKYEFVGEFHEKTAKGVIIVE